MAAAEKWTAIGSGNQNQEKASQNRNRRVEWKGAGRKEKAEVQLVKVAIGGNNGEWGVLEVCAPSST